MYALRRNYLLVLSIPVLTTILRVNSSKWDFVFLLLLLSFFLD